MSSQAGIWNFGGEPASQDILQRLAHAMSQYGPDGEYSYYNGSVGMTYCPFYTTRESRILRQPHISRNGDVVMWDGRLDNRDDFLRYLSNRPGNPDSDISLVMAGYEQWGTNLFGRLRGDWALSLWSPRQNTVVLAKDYAGTRPLYYTITEKHLMWSTDLRTLVLHSNVRLTVNEDYIAGYLASNPEVHTTPYSQIASVPPGSFVIIHNRQTSVHSYWRFDTQGTVRYKTDKDYEEHFRLVFRQAVRRRLRSDSPILAELSGGLDSSSIVCMADEIATQEAVAPLSTLSFFNTQEPGGDERVYFATVEEKRGRAGYHFDLADFPEHFSPNWRALVAVPGPLDRGGEFENALSALMQRGGHRVVLSGTGGDELLGGIPDPSAQLTDLLVHFKFAQLARDCKAWSLAKRRPRTHLLWDACSRLLPVRLRAKVTRLAAVPLWIDNDFSKRHDMALRQLGPTESFGFPLPSQQELGQSFAGVLRSICSRAPREIGCEERRYPLLDQDLVEFLISIPATQLLRPGERRSLMRRALASVLPSEVLHRKTKAFTARRYMVAIELNWPRLKKLFESSLLADLRVINPSILQKDLNQARYGISPQLGRIKRAIVLELWLQNVAQFGPIDFGRDRKLHLRANSLTLRCLDAVKDSGIDLR
jgi:asparagine synthase (glutamine-hydrolysing)